MNMIDIQSATGAVPKTSNLALYSNPRNPRLANGGTGGRTRSWHISILILGHAFLLSRSTVQNTVIN